VAERIGLRESTRPFLWLVGLTGLLGPQRVNTENLSPLVTVEGSCDISVANWAWVSEPGGGILGGTVQYTQIHHTGARTVFEKARVAERV